jgi:peptidoglycan glycosyltransferase
VPRPEVGVNGKRRGGGTAVRFLIALGVALIARGAWHAVGAADLRSPVPHSRTRSPGNEAAVCGVGREELMRLLADGATEGRTPSGTNVTLTLAPGLQKDMFDLFRRYDPAYGVFAAMEPATGRVVALVGYRRGGTSDPELPLRAIYPAASLVKVVTAAAALETGRISPEDEIRYWGGIYRLTPRGLRARAGPGAPAMTLEDAIAKSANAVFGRVAVEYVGRRLLETYLEKFGFGAPIPFCLPVGLSHAEIPSDEFHLARTGAGFGDVYVSPLHVAMIMSAIASEGEMPAPILIERVTAADGAVLYETSPAKWRDAVAPDTAEALLRMMVKTIQAGTSRRAFGTPRSTPLLQDMEVAGKTGSLSGWSPRMRFEWFAGVAPVEDAQLAVAALVVNDDHWKIKGSFVGREAFSSYFGYPQSAPLRFARHRSGKRRGATSTRKRRLRARTAGGNAGAGARRAPRPSRRPRTSGLFSLPRAPGHARARSAPSGGG